MKSRDYIREEHVPGVPGVPAVIPDWLQSSVVPFAPKAEPTKPVHGHGPVTSRASIPLDARIYFIVRDGSLHMRELKRTEKGKRRPSLPPETLKWTYEGAICWFLPAEFPGVKEAA